MKGYIKREEVSKLTNIMFKYSAIKIRINFSEPYSTLKPLTNSLSPSTKSKGVRLVSANIDKYQKKKRPPIKNTPTPPPI